MPSCQHNSSKKECFQGCNITRLYKKKFMEPDWFKYVQRQQKPMQGQMQSYLRLLVDPQQRPNSPQLQKEMTWLQLK